MASIKLDKAEIKSAKADLYKREVTITIVTDLTDTLLFNQDDFAMLEGQRVAVTITPAQLKLTNDPA